METTWKARQMKPSVDTIRVMATHYGHQPHELRDAIMRANATVIREDGFKGKIVMLTVPGSAVGKAAPKVRVVGWSDGQIGVDTFTMKVTRKAIQAASAWAWQQVLKKDADN